MPRARGRPAFQCGYHGIRFDRDGLCTHIPGGLPVPHDSAQAANIADSQPVHLYNVPATRGHDISQLNPLPQRRILPADGEGKCAVQHSVLVSQ